MNILLTGHQGFIGKNLYNQLKLKYNVIGFDLKSGQDILKDKFPDNINLVIHLAGLSSVKDSLKNPQKYWITNVIGTKKVFDYYKNIRVLYASSSTAHEPWQNPYAMSKFCMEKLEHKNI